ncbi:Nn.00g020550.m01.CDS01 [Neocucurbitaria sp. VM-36]
MATHPTYLIACAESYLSPSLLVEPSTSNDPSAPALHLIPSATHTKLRNLGPARVKDMRMLGQIKQIISHIPIAATAQTCTKINDAVYAANRLNADKFIALALLPSSVGDGKEAARELQRCITKYRFVGGVVGLSRGTEGAGGLGDGSFEELWSTAEKLRVPIALREMWPAQSELPNYQRNLPGSVLAPLVIHMHTLHTDTSLQILHLYLSSTFDRYPGLRLILCHPGILPSQFRRISTLLSLIPEADKPKRSFLDVWQHNFYLTTTDVQDVSSLRALLEQIPLDRVLYASNYPLEERGKEVMEDLRESGFVTREEWEKVAFRNAGVLFRLKGGSAGKAPLVQGLLK